MESSFKNKNFLVIVFEILIIVLGLVGITFAASRILNDRSTTLIIAGEYNVDYVGDTDVIANDLEPMSDSLVNINTTENVIRLEFSLRGVSTNDRDDLIYDVMIGNMNIDCGLLNKYTKWNLYKNGKLISNGSLDPAFDGDVLSENMRLTNIQEDLPEYNDEYDKYVLLFWISEACDDIETCDLVDQSGIINSKMDMKVFIALYSGAKKKFERVPNYDTSCANKPYLFDNMIPVTYNNGEWVKSTEDNSSLDNMWYDYGNQKWANAVVVSDKKYLDKEVGTKINAEDILGYYVWIPRYKYKLWNVEDTVTDSYNAYDEGIDIIFEGGTNNTVIETYKNNEYVTHPVFGENLTGIWISKYEVSENNGLYKFIPAVSSYGNDTSDNYKTIFSNLNNSYSLGDKADTHMVNNLEWGATLYLSHSKYGVCNGDGCSSIGKNMTYVSGSNKQDTTTRNVYGVYDMAGGSCEYVLGSYPVGSAMDEVMLEENSSWYGGYSVDTGASYVIRGGLDNGMFNVGGLGMSSCVNSSRMVISSK